MATTKTDPLLARARQLAQHAPRTRFAWMMGLCIASLAGCDAEHEVAQNEGEALASHETFAEGDDDGGIAIASQTLAVLDPTFSGDGREAPLTGVAAYGVDETGNFIAGEKNGNMAVAKLKFTNTSVVLDTSFGPSSTQRGVVELPLGVPMFANSAVADGEGGVIAVGAFTIVDPAAAYRYMIFCRISSNGTLDTRWGNGLGCIGPADFNVTGVNHAVAAEVAAAPDGGFVAAGFARSGYLTDGTLAGAQIGVAKFRKDGTLDKSFSGDGMVLTDITSSSMEGARDVMVQPDGRVIVVGWGVRDGKDSVVTARYLKNGELDTSFAGIGKINTLLESTSVNSPRAVLVDGALYIAANVVRDGKGHLALARFKADGTPDTNHGPKGVRIMAQSQAMSLIRDIRYNNASKLITITGSTEDGRTVGMRVNTVGGVNNREVVKFAQNTVGIGGREILINGAQFALRLYGLAHPSGGTPTLYVSQNTVNLPTTPPPPMEPAPTPPGGIGDACVNTSGCQSGLRCSPSEFVCVHPIAGLCNDAQDVCCDACAAGGTVCDTGNRYYCLDGFQCVNRIAGGFCKY